MGYTKGKSMEIPLCEPITSFGWLGSSSSRLVGKWTYLGTVYISTYMQTQYNEKWCKKTNSAIWLPNGGWKFFPQFWLIKK